jgi:hypothetical protein
MFNPSGRYKIYTLNELWSREAGLTAAPNNLSETRADPQIKPFSHPRVYKDNNSKRPEVNDHEICPVQNSSACSVPFPLRFLYHRSPSPPPTPKTAPCGMGPGPLGTTRPLDTRSLDEITPLHCLGDLPEGRSPLV